MLQIRGRISSIQDRRSKRRLCREYLRLERISRCQHEKIRRRLHAGLNLTAAFKSNPTAGVRRCMIIRILEGPPWLRRHGCKASILTGKPKARARFICGGDTGEIAARKCGKKKCQLHK